MRTRIVAAVLAGGALAAAPARAQDPAAPDLFRATPETYAPRYDPSLQPPAGPHPLVPYPIILDGRAAPARRQASPPGGRPAAEAGGYLSLFVQPVTAQIYVDGFFVGTVDDYRGSPGPSIEAGVHRVELRARGYESATFEVRIVPGGVVTHRGDLVRAGAAPASPAAGSAAGPPAAPAQARTFYVIPRCYAGDTAPRPADLPAGCDLATLRVVPPEGPEPAGATPARPAR